MFEEEMRRVRWGGTGKVRMGSSSRYWRSGKVADIGENVKLNVE